MSMNGYLLARRKIVDALDLEALLSWITPEIIEPIDNRLKDGLRDHIMLAVRRQGGFLKRRDQEILSQLPIFKELIACETKSGDLYRYKLKYDEYSNSTGRSTPIFKIQFMLCPGFHAFQLSQKHTFLMPPWKAIGRFSALLDIQCYLYKGSWKRALFRTSKASQPGSWALSLNLSSTNTQFRENAS
jgi:hypothetical protein